MIRYNLIQVNHPTSESLEFIPHSAWLGFHDIFQGPSSSFKLLALSQFPLFILMGGSSNVVMLQVDNCYSGEKHVFIQVTGVQEFKNKNNSVVVLVSIENSVNIIHRDQRTQAYVVLNALDSR